MRKTTTLNINERKITPLPIIPTEDFDKIFLANPLIKNPTKGKSGIR
ncbi:MAG: hypothetical protein WKF59_07030 [Chitinophagaceae bacterium]